MESFTELVPPWLLSLSIFLAAASGTMWLVWNKVAGAAMAVYNSLMPALVTDADDHLFYPLAGWLGYHRSRMRFVKAWEYLKHRDQGSLIPSEGRFLVKSDLGMVWVHKDRVEKENRDFFRYTLRVMSLNRAAVEQLAAAIAKFDEEEPDTIRRYLGTYWHRMGTRRDVPRLHTAAANRVADDVCDFLAKRSEYAERGVPYRRGYLLEGEPGTGKSNLIAHLSKYMDMPLHIIDTINSPFDVVRIIDEVVNKDRVGLLVLEDVDLSIFSDAPKTRTDHFQNPPDAPTLRDDPKQHTTDEEEQQNNLRLFLNALDGVAESSNFVFIATTNGRYELDPAFLRPGRIDVRITLEKMTAPEQIEYVQNFYGTKVGSGVWKLPNRTVAEVTDIVMSHSSPGPALKALEQGP